MLEEKMKEKRQGKIPLGFLYDIQFRRGANPILIILTKQGFFLSIFLWLLYMWGGGSLKLLLLSAVLYWIIYKKYFDEKYYELEKLWIINIFTNLLTFPVKSNNK